MTGKTHLAISAAAVAVLLASADAAEAGRHQASTGVSYPQPLERSTLATAGLLFLGMVAGLFPDVDAPDTELQHLPNRAAQRLGSLMNGGIPRHSAGGTLMREIAQLAVLPLTLSIGAIGMAVRAFTTHRGFTHTLWGALVFTGLVAGAALLFTGSAHPAWIAGAVWLLGYTSHLAADACTPSGIPLFGVAQGARFRRPRYSPHAKLGAARSRSHDRRVIHLLPNKLRVPTGSLIDTLLVRWVCWAVFVVAALRLF
jgi:membrane-bound metal-dependent hydrolase YbcI (DUF457 family)